MPFHVQLRSRSMTAHILSIATMFLFACVVWPAPAHACFEWCSWWSWGRNPQVPSVDQTPLLNQTGANQNDQPNPAELELVVAEPPNREQYEPPVLPPARDNFVRAYGMRESEIERTFDRAYGARVFSSPQQRNKVYSKWKQGIGKTELYWDEPRRETYAFQANEDYRLWATLYQGSNQLVFGFTERDSAPYMSRKYGIRENPLSMFGRAYVALGGRQSVNSIKEVLPKNSLAAFGFETMLRSNISPLSAANQTFAGNVANQFYDMSASTYYATSTAHIIVFEPNRIRPSLAISAENGIE